MLLLLRGFTPNQNNVLTSRSRHRSQTSCILQDLQHSTLVPFQGSESDSFKVPSLQQQVFHVLSQYFQGTSACMDATKKYKQQAMMTAQYIAINDETISMAYPRPVKQNQELRLCLLGMCYINNSYRSYRTRDIYTTVFRVERLNNRTRNV